MIKSALTILAVTGAFAQGGPPSDPVATVDGQPIERQVFEHWLTVAARSSGQANATVPDVATGYRECVAVKRKATPAKDRRKVTDTRLRKQCEREYAQLRNQVMQLLISFRWIEGEAVAQGVTVTDAEIDKDFTAQLQQSFPKPSDFEEFLRTSGQTREDILQRVRLDLLSNKIRAKVVADHDQVSEQEIAQFYVDNRSRFAVRERRALRVVLTKRKALAQRARAALERGDTWKAVARRYSIDTGSKRRGGKLPAQEKGTLDRNLDRAVFSADKDELVGPVRSPYGYYVFTVTKVLPARTQRLSEVKEAIRETLVAEAQQTALDAFVRDFTARWKAKTECAAGFTTSDCRNGPAAAPTPTPTA